MLIRKPVVRPVVVSDALAAKSGLGKNHVRVKEEYGGGYPVFVEGLHQLHCLVSGISLGSLYKSNFNLVESVASIPLLQYRLLSLPRRRAVQRRTLHPTLAHL